MHDAQAVSLKTISTADKPTLSRLLFDYRHELLPYSGRSDEEIMAYKYLPTYFVEADRAAYFIMAGADLAGFVLVNTHTLITPHARQIAEFYVSPSFRRQGVGARAAALAFAQFPGSWEVAEMGANKPAIRFWRRVVSDVTGGQYRETFLDTDAWHGPVQQFDVDKNQQSWIMKKRLLELDSEGE